MTGRNAKVIKRPKGFLAIGGLLGGGLLGVSVLAALSGTALAAQPQPWQMGFQPAATGVMDDIVWFESFTFWIVTVITLFVTALLAICLIKFRASANPTPSRTTHHTLLEVAWTVLPIVILVVIAIPSFRLLYKELVLPEADMTVKATGYQWYWGYEYPDEKYAGVSFDSIMLFDDEREERKKAANLTDKEVPRLLAVDNALVVPAGKTVRVQVTAADVIHSFAMPAFGVKVDAIPGRLNETWFKAREPGMYYGQCSELCGTSHAFMPIAIRVVTEEQFEAWAAAAKDDLEDAYKQLAEMIANDNKRVDVAQR